MVRARQGRVYLAGGAALTIAVSTALSFASFSGVDLANAAVTRAQSFLDLMQKRSPGKRTEAQLIKTKHKSFHVLADRPEPEAPAIVVPAYAANVGLVAPPLAVPAVGFPQPPQLAQVPPPLFFTPPPGVGILVPPKAPQPPPPVSVPEPNTWAMLIVGFGMVGWTLRRARQTKRVSLS
jgi:hypothetical protein